MRRLVWYALGVFGALAAAGAVLEALAWNGSPLVRALTVDPPLAGLVNAPAVAVTPVVGALIAAHRPQNRIGWLLLAIGIAGAWGWFTHGYALYGALAHPGALPAAGHLATLGQLSWLAFALPITLLLLWFPDGRPPGRRWWLVGGLAAVACWSARWGWCWRPGSYRISRRWSTR